MGLLDTLGIAGRTGGVDDERKFARERRLRNEVRRCALHQPLPRRLAAAANEDQVSQCGRARAYRFDWPHKFRLRDRDDSFAVEKNLFDFMLAEEKAARDHDRADLHRAQNCDHRLQICAKPQQDAVAAFDANSAQHVAEAIRELAHFGVRVGPLADPCRDLTATAGRHVMIDHRFGDIEALRDLQVGPFVRCFRDHFSLSANLPHLSRSLTSIGSLSNWRRRRQRGYGGSYEWDKKAFRY